jgi:hypothetical protein
MQRTRVPKIGHILRDAGEHRAQLGLWLHVDGP